jgi:MFS family permease
MSRTVAVVWHASFSIAAGVLYFFFVLPRWWELSGDTSPTLGTALRIVTGALIGLAALPVVFTLLRTRRPEFGTPQMALRLRTSSIVLHVLAGVLILGTAISEIWISLDTAGQWLFGIYGAAAAIALLGIFAFYLAFVAELPPPPPKPLKPKKAKQGRRGRKAAEDAAEESEEATEDVSEDAADETPEDAADEADAESAEVTAESTEAAEPESPEPPVEDEPAAESTNGGLRNRRRRRLRGRVAVED